MINNVNLLGIDQLLKPSN